MKNGFNNKFINYKIRLKALEITNTRIFYLFIAILFILLLICFGFHSKHISSYVFTIENLREKDKPIVCPRVKVDNIWYQTIRTSGNDTSKPMAFIKPVEAKNFDCRRIFERDEEYVKNLSTHRITYQDDQTLPTDCNSIRQRNYFPFLPNSREEAEYPIAYIRVIYKDYLLLEMALAAEYAPQNFYCYVIDKKSKAIFKQQIRNLRKCFPNVFVSDNEFDTDSTGKQMNYAYLECMKILSKYQWNYLILLQNHDVITKTNYEIMQIFHLFCGANDARVQEPMIERINESLDWTIEGLNLLKNPEKFPKSTMTFAKGQAQNSLSRKMVDFMLNELNLTKILVQLEGRYGIDELLIPMLQATEELDVPGGFTRKCIKRRIAVNDITRHSFWIGVPDSKCYSNIFRQKICILGIEDIPRLRKLPQIFINKMMPEYDFGAITCWYEYMFNRSHMDPPMSSSINPMFYLSLPHVRYHYEKMRINGKVDLENFDCNFHGVINLE